MAASVTIRSAAWPQREPRDHVGLAFIVAPRRLSRRQRLIAQSHKTLADRYGPPPWRQCRRSRERNRRGELVAARRPLQTGVLRGTAFGAAKKRIRAAIIEKSAALMVVATLEHNVSISRGGGRTGEVACVFTDLLGGQNRRSRLQWQIPERNYSNVSRPASGRVGGRDRYRNNKHVTTLTNGTSPPMVHSPAACRVDLQWQSSGRIGW
jgi:hypothetical protein